MEQTVRWRKKQPIQAAATCLVLLLFCGSSIWGDALSPGLHGEIEYARVNGQPLWLDAFVPDGEGPHAVVILVHGGGWVGGDKQEMHFLAEPLVQAGFTCFSPGYRLAPQHRWPACLDDVQTAIRWVKAHAADYQGNPDQIALLGYSAGGHLACMAAVQEPVDAVVALAAPTDHLADSMRRGGLSECIQKLLDRPKAIDAQSKAVLEAISPINHVRTCLPAYLLIHGTADQSVPYEQSAAFQAELKAHHVPCRLITLEGATHRISKWTTYNVDYQQQIIGWLTSTVGGKRQPTPIGETRVKTMTVSADGSADFETVQAAVDAVPEWNPSPVVIAIAPGTYKERIVVPRSKRFVTFRGEDAELTVLTFDLSARMKDETGNELGTFRTPSVTIEADDFTAENITFENSAGDVGQAVALMAAGDRAVFRNCRFLGWQDTLLDQAGRHYYEKCHIAGHCDFIFGGGTAFFETCRIHCLDGSYITAASTPPHQPYGYVFSNCTITGEPEDSKTYLGRPWRDYAHVVFLNTEMSDIIRPAGWHNWSKPHREKTAFYGEYNSTGPGANPQQRVAWAHQLTADQAVKYTLEQVLSGDDGWNPMTQTVQTAVTITPAGPAQIAALKDAAEQQTRDGSAFLFTASSEKNDGVSFFLSRDGLTWNRLTGPLLRPVDSEQTIIDPCLSRGPDGTFHLVWQNGPDNPLTIGYTRSDDLVHWKPRRFFEPMKGKDALHVLAPAVFYDPADAAFIMMWASTLGGNYYQAYQEPVERNLRLWYNTTKDFETFTEAEPLFEPGYAVGKAAVVRHEGRYVLVHEDSRLAFGTLRTAFGDSPTGPWRHITNALPQKKGLNPAVLKLGETYIVYFDSDASTRGALVTQDFLQWVDVSASVSFPRGVTYGRVIKVDAAVVEQLMRSQSLSEIR